MGMFDTIRVDLACLPKSWRKREFQTKDLGVYPNLDHYELRADGKLYLGGERSHSNFTGEVEFYDWEYPKLDVNSNKARLLSFRATFVFGVCMALRGPADPWDNKFPGWDNLPNLMEK